MGARAAIRIAALALLVACGKPGRVEGVDPLLAPGSVALIDWQFAVDGPRLRTNPEQPRLTKRAPALRSAFYPHLSEENAAETEAGLGRLVRHAGQVRDAFVAGRDDLVWPFLLNISPSTPDAMRALIARGVRIFSVSSGATSALDGLDAVIAAHPEVIVVVATPHISGNSITVDALGERPSVLAARYPNVLLAGCLAWTIDETPGAPGTADDPFWVNNQPAEGRQIFLVGCEATRVFAEGFGGTSAAAPHVASLLGEIQRRRVANGEPADGPDLLTALDGVSHRGFAREKSGVVHEVAWISLDTVLVNLGEPLVTDRIWIDGSAHLEPILLP